MNTHREQLLGTDSFSAEVVVAGEPGYDESRSIFNGLIDNRPAAIFRCLSDEDVAEAVTFARDRGLEISVKGGGHAPAGLAITHGGVMIDLSRRKTITIDDDTHTVRAGAGITWGELTEAAQAHGLAPVGGMAPSVGITGLTLGGGKGWLSAKHGLAVDNLLEARVVTADGRVLTTNTNEHPDLFWALRGGGGNFGIVTEFTYRLHPIRPAVVTGQFTYPLDAARDVLRFFREYTESGLSDELVIDARLTHAPDGSGLPVAALTLMHLGPEEEALREIAPVVAWGSPLTSKVSQMSFAEWLIEHGGRFPKGLGNDLKSSFLNDLSDDAIDAFVETFATCPSPLTSITIDNWHGACSRVPVDATAVAYRGTGYDFYAFSAWTLSDHDEENHAWSAKIYDAIEPFFGELMFPNYLGAAQVNDDRAPIRAYGPNLDRLVEVKTAYDPGNVFHLNLNIVPRETVPRQTPEASAGS